VSDEDIEACNDLLDLAEALAEVADCTSEYNALIKCMKSESECTGGSYAPPEGSCASEDAAWNACTDSEG
jgi:hypothetical protein